MMKNRWLIALLAMPLMGDPLSIHVSTSALSGTSGELAFDFTDGGPPSNSAQISTFATDGTLSTFSTTGSVAGTLATTVTLSDSSFFSEFLQSLTLGTSISFELNQGANPPAAGSFPDEFSFYLLNAAGNASLITTTDPTGSDALFVVDSDGTSTGAITVYTSSEASATVTPEIAATPEPSSLWLLITVVLLFAVRWRPRTWRWAGRACLLIGGAAMAGSMASAQNYNFVKVVDYGTPRPDGQGAGKFSAYGWPATDGTTVSWLEANFVTGHWDSMWSNVIGATTYTKLVDTSTAAPGGTGNFTTFSGAASTGTTLEMSQGNVLFTAIDSKPSQPYDGLFTVPAAGGPVGLIANYNTNGGEFTGFGLAAGKPSSAIAGNHVAFDAHTATGYDGVFSTTLSGGGINTLAIGSSPCHTEFVFPVIIFAGAATDGNNTVFYGQNVFDPSLGYDALYLNDCAHEILTVNTPLPGDPNSSVHTRFLYELIRMSNGVIAFVADNANSGGSTYYRGIFTYSGGTLQKVVSSLDSLPGLGALIGTSSFNGISLANGAIAFRAQDSSNDALFIASGGTITRVIGMGDPLDGGHVFGASASSVFDPTPNALAPNGTFAFNTQIGIGIFAMYAAVPNCAADVSSQVSVTVSGFRLNRANQQYVQTVTLTNTSSSTLTTPLSLVLNNLTNATLANATGTTTCAAQLGRPYLSLGSGGLGAGASVSGVLSFSDPSNLGIQYTTSVLGGGTLPR